MGYRKPAVRVNARITVFSDVFATSRSARYRFSNRTIDAADIGSNDAGVGPRADPHIAVTLQ